MSLATRQEKTELLALLEEKHRRLAKTRLVNYCGYIVRPRQMAGLAVATLGLACVGHTVGSGGVILAGLLLTLAAAACWATGNVLLRGAGPTDMLSLVVWLSFIPPLPLLVLSCLFEHPEVVLGPPGPEAWVGVLAVLYIALAATLGGYGMWGYLLKLYPASAVAPFALLVPVFGLLSARLTVGEPFGGLRLGGIALMVLGLVAASLPFGRRHARRIIGDGSATASRSQ